MVFGRVALLGLFCEKWVNLILIYFWKIVTDGVEQDLDQQSRQD